MPIDDPELLRRYAETGSEEAFAELVRRRIGLVYSVALRHTRDTHRAEDVTQAVFAALARKAGELSRRPVLLGWLYRSAQFAASDAVRVAVRRQTRGQEAHTMQQIASETPDPEWEKLRPVLDEALNEMDERDRDAVLLRYFDNQPFAAIGARLRLSENAARMRVDRALEKLHAALSRRGVTSTAAALGAALAVPAGATVPAGLATSVAGAAMAGAAGAVTAGGTAAGWLTFMGMTKLQLVITGALAVAGATGYVVQGETNAALRQEIAALQAPLPELAALRTENQRLISAQREVEELRRDDVELKRLEQRVVEVKQAGVEKARIERARKQVSLRQSLEAGLREKDRRAQLEVDRMNEEGNALVAAYKQIEERAKAPDLAPDARTFLKQQGERLLAEITAKQREVREFIDNARKAMKAEAAQLPPAPGAGAFELSPGSPEVRRIPGAASVPGRIELAPSPKPGASSP